MGVSDAEQPRQGCIVQPAQPVTQKGKGMQDTLITTPLLFDIQD